MKVAYDSNTEKIISNHKNNKVSHLPKREAMSDFQACVSLNLGLGHS